MGAVKSHFSCWERRDYINISYPKTSILSEMVSLWNKKEIQMSQILSYQVHYFEENKENSSDVIKYKFSALLSKAQWGGAYTSQEQTHRHTHF